MLKFEKRHEMNMGDISVIDIIFEGKKIGTTTYRESNNALHLTWIEIDESKQRKGHGSGVLDYFANMSIAKHLDLVIQVVNEELLNDFYLKWFTRWGKSKGADVDDIKAIFNQSILEDNNPKLILETTHLMCNQTTHNKP